MSVFIKGVEIPKNCGYCNADLACAAKCIRTQRLVLPSEYDTSKRHPACPLGELPPHGDLIDRDRLKHKFCTHCDGYEYDTNSCVDGDQDCMDVRLIMSTPVVVPAERSEP